jgi:hypothetical protein
MSREVAHALVGASPDHDGDVQCNADEERFARHMGHWWMNLARIHARQCQVEKDIAETLLELAKNNPSKV